MSYLNRGSSIYHEIQALYWRSLDGNLLASEGRHAAKVEGAWTKIWTEIEALSQEQNKVPLPSGGWLEKIQLTPSYSSTQEDGINASSATSELLKDSEQAVVSVQEMRRPGQDSIVGMVSIVPENGLQATEFRDWTCRFILSETQFLPFRRVKDAASEDSQALETAQRITQVFEKELRHIAPNDQWITGGGRDYFLDRVFGFTQYHAQIRLCLPAFPCKSSNRQKTNGEDPDRAEEMALDVLRTFVREVAAFYEPGARISIISDGHVFSDCIGVDDDTVDSYSRKLQDMEQNLVGQPHQDQAIEFVSLWDIFFSNPELCGLFATSWLKDVEVPHFVDTKHSEDAELCRKLLLASCQIDPGVLSDLIKGEDKATLALYRGFSRFMLEDLAVHPSCMGKSSSQRKKLATKVAGEMMKRNQAYSNLVELLYPSHLRLSIHAHDNRGPKFGIRLFPAHAVRSIKSFADREEPATQELLHTPTPWHNCLIEVKGDPTLYLAKSRVALEVLGDNRYQGSWVSANSGGSGKYFSLYEPKGSSVNHEAGITTLHRL